MKHSMTKVAALIAAALVVSVAPAAADDARPSNDDFAAAEQISEMPYDNTAATQGATLESGELQPSCSPITSSVWYRFSPAESLRAITQASATAPSAVAIFTGESLETLTELRCGKGFSFELSFDAVAGQVYFLQVGSIGKQRGTIDLGLVPDTWREQELQSFSHTVDVPRTTVDVVTIDGRPRAGDRSMYDLTLETAGQTVQRGVLTFGLVQEQIHQELVTIDHTAATIEAVLSYRYDTAQQQCATDSGPGGSCTVKSPVKDLRWLLQDGSDAELIITIAVRDSRGLITTQRTLVVPFAGQVVGIL